MDLFCYSIVIRTLGNAGEKYSRLLESIEKQTVKPLEVIVVIPHGYTLGCQKGNERVVYSEKGMVSQRSVGIQEARGEFLLVLDDDVAFPPDFVEKMHTCMVERELDCVLAFGENNVQNGQTERTKGKQRVKETLKRLRGAFTGQYFYSNRRSDYFDTITRTAGHRTYVNETEKLCQTGCFQCFFIKRESAVETHFEDEKWLEQGTLSQYAAYDDAVFFYKAFSHGCRIAYTSDTNYLHLDAAAGRSAKDKLTSKKIRLYTIARNRTVFWRRHILTNRPGALTWIAGFYGLGNYALYSTVINLLPKNWPAIAALFAGYRDAIRFIRNK